MVAASFDTGSGGAGGRGGVGSDVGDLPWIERDVDPVQTRESDVLVVVCVVASAGRLGLVEFGARLEEGVPWSSFGVVFTEIPRVGEGRDGATYAHTGFVARLVVPVAHIEVDGATFWVGLGALGEGEGVLGGPSFCAGVEA